MIEIIKKTFNNLDTYYEKIWNKLLILKINSMHF